jgi:hypothetical protein
MPAPLSVVVAQTDKTSTQQEICCPPGMSCYLTALSISNIYCRPPLNGSTDKPQPGSCHPTFASPPVCQPGTQHCNETEGGACCPLDTACAPGGCVRALTFEYPPPTAGTTALPSATWTVTVTGSKTGEVCQAVATGDVTSGAVKGIAGPVSVRARGLFVLPWIGGLSMPCVLVGECLVLLVSGVLF